MESEIAEQSASQQRPRIISVRDQQAPVLNRPRVLDGQVERTAMPPNSLDSTIAEKTVPQAESSDASETAFVSDAAKVSGAPNLAITEIRLSKPSIISGPRSPVPEAAWAEETLTNAEDDLESEADKASEDFATLPSIDELPKEQHEPENSPRGKKSQDESGSVLQSAKALINKIQNTLFSEIELTKKA